MDASLLDNKISKDNQMRLIIALLCINIFYTILINVLNTASANLSDLQKIFFNVSIVLVFLYLYKFIRYDLKLQLFFAFISIEVLVNMYYIVLIFYKFSQGMGSGETAFGSYEQTYSFAIGISFLRLIALMGIAIQLLLNKYFNRKIKIAIQVLGVCFILHIIGPFVTLPLIGMLHGTTVESSVIDDMYRYTNLFFTILPYVSMVGLYVLALDQNDADVSIEENENITLLDQ